MTIVEPPARTATCIICGAPARPDEFHVAGLKDKRLRLCSDRCAVALQEQLPADPAYARSVRGDS